MPIYFGQHFILFTSYLSPLIIFVLIHIFIKRQYNRQSTVNPMSSVHYNYSSFSCHYNWRLLSEISIGAKRGRGHWQISSTFLLLLVRPNPSKCPFSIRATLPPLIKSCPCLINFSCDAIHSILYYYLKISLSFHFFDDEMKLLN